MDINKLAMCNTEVMSTVRKATGTRAGHNWDASIIAVVFSGFVTCYIVSLGNSFYAG